MTNREELADGMPEPRRWSSCSSAPWLHRLGSGTEREHVKFRLKASEVGRNTTLARGLGLDIQLDAGWQFYSENPGELGVAPKFDWSESRNVRAVSIQWPEPTRYVYSEDPPLSTLGYRDSVFLPIRITQKEPDRPSKVHLRLSYAICNDYCISDRVKLQVGLPPGDQKGARPRVQVTEDRQ